MGQPLADLRIICIEQFGAGPWASMQLADLGAEVIKVEDPNVGGDVGRYVPPFSEGDSSLYFETFNRNKYSVCLDLKSTSGRRVLEDLVKRVDAVFSNLRGDQPERLGIRFQQLRHLNERVVCCSLSGFGMTGPRSAEGAYDHTVQALAGWDSLTGEPEGPPVKSGLSLVDFSAGYVAAIAILAAVWQARREGTGRDVDLSLFDVALSELTYIGTWAASRDYLPVRRPHSAHQSLVPFQTFETADSWIVIACPKQNLWIKLCAAIDHPELAEDKRFATFADRDQNRVQLLTALSSHLKSRSTGEWLDVLRRAGVPCAPINDVNAAMMDEQASARTSVVAYEHESLGRVRQVASPFRFSDSTSPIRRGPHLGEHTVEILERLCGLGSDEVSNLSREGAFGSPSRAPTSVHGIPHEI